MNTSTLPVLCCRCQKAPVQRAPNGAALAYCGDDCREASMRDFEAGKHRSAEAAACLGDWPVPVAPTPVDETLRARLRTWSPSSPAEVPPPLDAPPLVQDDADATVQIFTERTERAKVIVPPLAALEASVSPAPAIVSPAVVVDSPTDVVDSPKAEIASFDYDAPLEAWCDGSGTVATKPAGVGVVIARLKHPPPPDDRDRYEVLCEASVPIGRGSNQRAEVCALGLALRLAFEVTGSFEHPVTLCSDSEFALGACAPDSTWRIRVAPLVEPVSRARALAAQFPRLVFKHVPGHSGLELNERADKLAGRARKAAIAAAAQKASAA